MDWPDLECPLCDNSEHSQLFDHFIGLQYHRWRHSKAERAGGFNVYRHLEFNWHLDWQIGALRGASGKPAPEAPPNYNSLSDADLDKEWKKVGG